MMVGPATSGSVAQAMIEAERAARSGKKKKKGAGKPAAKKPKSAARAASSGPKGAKKRKDPTVRMRALRASLAAYPVRTPDRNSNG